MKAELIVCRGVIAVVFAGLLAAGTYAQSQDPTPQQQDIQNDKKDIRNDKTDLHKDRKDLRHDKRGTKSGSKLSAFSYQFRRKATTAARSSRVAFVCFNIQ